jgi:phosphoribosylamine---glycine ligase
MGPDTSVLLLGAGGREHALAWKLAQSPKLKNLFALPGSDAMSPWAQCIPGDPCDGAAVVKAAKDNHCKLVVIGPEAPLAAGVADACRVGGTQGLRPGQGRGAPGGL